jgi:hypothetical protein
MNILSQYGRKLRDNSIFSGGLFFERVKDKGVRQRGQVSTFDIFIVFSSFRILRFAKAIENKI